MKNIEKLYNLAKGCDILAFNEHVTAVMQLVGFQAESTYHDVANILLQEVEVKKIPVSAEFLKLSNALEALGLCFVFIGENSCIYACCDWPFSDNGRIRYNVAPSPFSYETDEILRAGLKKHPRRVVYSICTHTFLSQDRKSVLGSVVLENNIDTAKEYN